MEKMTVKDIQQVSLDILKDVHEFCVENNIQYTLFGGTLIGAIRHNGFIPWDDDVDIAMPRPDYERFIKTYKSKKRFSLFHREKGKNDVYLAYSRVCDMERTFVDTVRYPWSTKKTGIWIDIFPLDGMPDDINKAISHTKLANTLFYRGAKARTVFAIPRKKQNIVAKFKRYVKSLLLPFYCTWDSLIEVCLKYDYSKSNAYSNLSFGGYGMKEYCSKDVLNNFILHKFEDAEFYIMSGYDKALTCKYGDYMTPPPVDKQVGVHSYDYYWK